ncbi:tRNA pseudouridine(55) synthase TruB [bacterium]|nr:tRNA pseudouridine(55) synthase TruB [bacterium]MCK4437137.1 tRNA pseudouridine(55) synthase TruB [bacterium]
MMDGILNINKPRGITSHDVILQVRRIFRMKKVGHTGTLDPEATGVLITCLGKATKAVRFLTNHDKEYEGVMVLGVSTDTQDSSGRILREVDKLHVSEAEIMEAANRFQGEIEQIPPMVSAVHHQGRRLYQLARQGKVVERTPRKVKISFKILKVELPRVRFSIVCSKGTYVRTICADMGEALGCGAHQAELTRIRSGPFHIKHSVSLEQLREAPHPENFLSACEPYMHK